MLPVIVIAITKEENRNTAPVIKTPGAVFLYIAAAEQLLLFKQPVECITYAQH